LLTFNPVEFQSVEEAFFAATLTPHNVLLFPKSRSIQNSFDGSQRQPLKEIIVSTVCMVAGIILLFFGALWFIVVTFQEGFLGLCDFKWVS
jgi:hypothetical protein